MKSLPKNVVLLSALIAFGAALCVAAWGAPPFAPKQGLLLLKNGQVLEGGILREGDRYVVSLGERGERGELKIPATDVDTACQTLEEAYAHKRAQIIHRSVKPHLDLAEWCLRNQMVDRAADELVAAMAIDAHDPKIAAVERRMKLAAAPPTKRAHEPLMLPPTQEEIEAAIRTVPAAALEEFTSNIQPLLLSRCAVTACHGPGSTASYRLVRPPLRHANKTRETQRNLFATLAQINPDGESSLLAKPLAAHGGSETPILDQHDRRQIEMLAAWIERVKVTPARSAENRDEDSFVRPASFEEDVRAPSVPKMRRLPGVAEPREFQPEASSRPLLNDASVPGKPTTGKKPPAGRDPFDPQLFNQRYHPDQR